MTSRRTSIQIRSRPIRQIQHEKIKLDSPKILSIFNNKGGVGKTTLAYHFSHALAEMNYRVLMIDLDPQCNLTIYGMDQNELHDLWLAEDAFIDAFDSSKEEVPVEKFEELTKSTRSVHFLLKPTEEGTAEIEHLPPPKSLGSGVDMIPGRLTMHMYEEKVSVRWSDLYRGDPLAIRTVTRIRQLALDYAKKYAYDFIIIDTSPSLGSLNKVIISTVDGFFVPCLPDLFSLYGLRNIGNSLQKWNADFQTIYTLISSNKRELFPKHFVKFFGYTIYNAKKRSKSSQHDLAQAHQNYANLIPETIEEYIPSGLMGLIPQEIIKTPIGGRSIMHSHNTLPNMAQKYKCPIWLIPTLPNLDEDDIGTIRGNKKSYEDTKSKYLKFAHDVIKRINES